MLSFGVKDVLMYRRAHLLQSDEDKLSIVYSTFSVSHFESHDCLIPLNFGTHDIQNGVQRRSMGWSTAILWLFMLSRWKTVIKKLGCTDIIGIGISTY